MSDMSGAGQQSLGIGAIVGDSFSIFFRHFFWILLLSLLPIILLIVFGVTMSVSINSMATGGAPSATIIVLIVAFALLIFIAYLLTIAMIVRLAYDAKTGHPVRIGDYFTSAFGTIVPVFLCSLIIWLCAVAGVLVIGGAAAILGNVASVILALAAIAGGLYLYVIWIAVIPVIIVENLGLSSFGRSMTLTSDYRWPCLGAIVIMFICLFGMSLAIGIVQFVAGAIFGEIGAGIVSFISSGLAMGLSGIFIALIYARLREIKDGTSVESLAEVFA